jgi:AcrR family transcriptional regulator
VTSADPVAVSRVGSTPYSAAQTRIVNAAIEQFALHGIGGTSLQMIADVIGVTKAAVYHQFKTKEEIVIAVAEANLARLEGVLDAAEAEPDRQRAVDVLLTQLIDLAVEHRRIVTIQNDPIMVRLLTEHEPFRRQMDRLHDLLIGDDPSADVRVPAAMLSAAIISAAAHPLVTDVDDETLRSNLLDIARRYLDLP